MITTQSCLRFTHLMTAILGMVVCLTAYAGAAELDVRDFGAVCDGVTDDTAAVQRAFDAAGPGDSVVISGICAISAQGVLLEGKQRVTVRGGEPLGGLRALEDGGRSIEGFGPFLMVVRGCTDTTVRDLDFDCRNLDVGGLGVEKSSAVTVEGNTVRDVGQVTGGCISASGNRGNRYVRNTIRDARADSEARGFWLGNHWETALEWEPYIGHNHVHNAGGTGIATHAIGLTAEYNRSDENRGSGIKLVPGPEEISRQVSVVRHNIFSRNQFNSVQIDHGHHVLVHNNLMEHSGGPGVYLAASCRYVAIENNVIRNNDEGRGGWHGGIEVQIAEGLVIRGNLIEDTREGGDRRQTVGIWLLARMGPIRNAQVYGNTIRNNTAHGIRVDAEHEVSGLVLGGNLVSENAGFGLSITEKAEGNLTDLSLAEAGIIEAPADGTTVAGVVEVRAPQPRANEFTGNRAGEIEGLRPEAVRQAPAAGWRLLLNGGPLGPETAPLPLTLAWDTTGVADGEHLLAVERSDQRGVRQVTGTVRVIVANAEAPTGP